MNSTRRSASFCMAVWTVGALASAVPAAADWLVTRDGSAIETEGPWRLDGEQIVFTLRGSGLAALPVAEVDLDASRERTSPVAAVAAAPAPASRWTITDADVDRALDADDAGPEGGEQSSAVAGVAVASWQEIVSEDLGVSLTGTLRNDGADYAAGLRVQVALHDEAGELIERRATVPSATTLAPGESAEFTIAFPDVVAFADIRFSVEGRGFSAARPAVGSELPAEGAGALEEEAFEEESLEEEYIEEVPEEYLDETYGEGIEEEAPMSDESLEAEGP